MKMREFCARYEREIVPRVVFAAAGSFLAGMGYLTNMPPGLVIGGLLIVLAVFGPGD